MQNKRVPTCVVALISASLCVGCSKDERSDATGSKDGTAKKGDASGARANKGANKHAFGLALTRLRRLSFASGARAHDQEVESVGGMKL